ncbi:MAG: hypothetical protein ACI9WU_002097 [Myxococcota bacterium]|jgi:hypothetical protein
MRNLIITSLALSLAFVGCAKDDGEVIDPASLIGGDERPAGKADCPNCDETGPNAFIQAGLETRFYKGGDKWHVAFQFRNRGMMGKEDVLFADAETQSGIFLFEYEALRVRNDVFRTSDGGDQRREVVEIAVTQVDPAKVGLDGAGYFESERLDRQQHKVHFTMNDLTDALEVTYFDRQYPNGHTVQAPRNSALSLTDSIFPVNVPRLLRGSASVIGSEVHLPQDLEVIANSLDATWRDRSYKRFAFENGDIVYWAKGYLWPFYIENAQGRGLLIDGLAN